MPFVEGKIYAELREKLHKHHTLNIVRVGPDDTAFNKLLRENNVLKAYIDDKLKGIFHIVISRVDTLTAEEVQDYASDNDIDLIWINELALNDDQWQILKNIVKIVNTKTQVQSEIEAFLVGNGVSWVHEEPVWNSDLLMRYTHKPGVAREAFDFLSKAETDLHYNPELLDRLRYLGVKASTVFYGYDTLLYILQARRKSRRRGYDKQQNYTIELNYNLTNYYFLMAGAFDILARILNQRFGLSIDKFTELGLEKKSFTRILREQSVSIAEYLSEPETKKWIRWLKRRRNFIAHEAGIRNSPLVIENDVPLTEQEVESIVDKQLDWNFIKDVMPEVYDSHRELVRNLTIYQHNYREVMDDVIVVETFGKKEICLPLQAVDYDFKTFSTIVQDVIGLIISEGPRKESQDSTTYIQRLRMWFRKFFELLLKRV